MDEYIFRSYMDNCSYDEEPTSYLEILTYSVGKLILSGPNLMF